MFLGRIGRRSTRWLVNTVLPPLCPGCDTEMPSVRWICAGCRRRLRRVPERWLCLFCRLDERKRKGREAGLDCRVPEHAAWRGRTAFWMEPPLDQVIHRMKYAGCSGLTRPLAHLIARDISARGDGVTAVPLHRTRLRERGYNQADLLAKELARRWGIPHLPDLLCRRRSTRVQARLQEDERSANLRGAFQVGNPNWVSDRSWILVDDVVTTGSTLAECLQGLRSSGARAVLPVAVALA